MHSSLDGCLRFRLLVVVNKAAMNTDVQSTLCPCVSTYPEAELVAHVVILSLNF